MIKTFLKNLFLFSIPLILIALVLEVYLRNRTSQNEILAKLELINQNKNAELIFIGNSHGRNAFIPEKIDQNSINLCIGGSTPFYNTELIKSVIPDLPNLKYIVYNISYQTLFYDLDSLPDEKKKYEFYHYLGADPGIKKGSIDYLSILSTIGLKKAVNNVTSDFSSQEISLLETKGHKIEYGNIATENTAEIIANRIEAHHKLMNIKKVAYNTSQLSILEETVAPSGIKIIYVILPVVEEYITLMKKPYDQFATQMENFTKDRKHLFLNIADSLKLDHTHFVDPDHLNEKGANEVSSVLSELIKTQNNN